jgi:hypothetical protein
MNDVPDRKINCTELLTNEQCVRCLFLRRKCCRRIDGINKLRDKIFCISRFARNREMQAPAKCTDRDVR